MRRDDIILEIHRCLKTKWAGREIVHFPETDSTNIQAKELGAHGCAHGTLVVADNQTEGRGRRGRRWESPQGNNIYMSLVLRPSFSPNKAPMLTLVMAISVAKAIQELTSLQVQIKWPNDILLNKKKLCGILTEMSVEDGQIQYVVLGVGVNMENPQLPEEIADMATSLTAETKRTCTRAKLVSCILKWFERLYETFEKGQSFMPYQNIYNSLLVNKDQSVRVHDPEGAFDGIAEGINRRGALLVRKEDGSLAEVSAGEVSVRGIYGYV